MDQAQIYNALLTILIVREPYLFVLFQITCGVILLVKYGSSPTGLLGASAFLMWASIRLARHAYLLPVVDGGLEYIEVLRAQNLRPGGTGLIAYALLCAGLILIPRSAELPPRLFSGLGEGHSNDRPLPRSSMKTGLFLGSVAVSGGAVLVVMLFALPKMASDGPDAGIAMALWGLIPATFAFVVLLLLVHRMWSAIQAGPARVTPGRAVAFLLIPLFNLYWLYKVWYGWARDFNRYVRQRELDVPVVSENLALAICVVTTVSLIPPFNLVLGVVNYVLLLVFVSKACSSLDALAIEQAR